MLGPCHLLPSSVVKLLPAALASYVSTSLGPGRSASKAAPCQCS